MIKFRTRFLFALITLIITVLIGLGLLLGQLFKGYYLKTFDERLMKESKLISSYLTEKGGINSLQTSILKDFSKRLDARITVVNRSGTIAYDSGNIDDTSESSHKQMIKEIIKKKSSDKAVGHEKGEGYSLHYYLSPIEIKGKKEGYVLLSSKAIQIQEAYKQIWWILIMCLGLALIVIILLGSKIASRYTKPIESATTVAIELAKGNYRARTYENQMDEVGMLSTSINILARNLQEMKKAQEIQQDRLEALIENIGSGLILIDSRGYITLINRAYKEIFHVRSEEYLFKLYYEVIHYKEISKLIEEIFITEQKIKKQVVIPLSIERRHFEIYGVPIIGTNDVWKGILLVFHDITELKKLEQIRRDFVANVSHELKTPITSIRGFSETLLDGAMEDKKSLEDFLHIILKESDRMQSLIQDLLDLSKMEQHGFTLSTKKVNVSKLIEDVVVITKGRAIEKNIQLRLENELDIEIEGDLYRLKQVFINLITNAISYTPEKGKVVISLINKKDSVLVIVKDTGIGIEKAEVPRIFERFYRVDRARSRNSGGTGLGLAIVKHLVEAHKGTITVQSVVGKGTSFKIELYKEIPK